MPLEVGAPIGPWRIACVSPETLAAWAPILGDPNPLHLDRAAVRARGLGDRLIAQGPISVGYVVDMLHRAFPGGFVERLSNRFVDNVYDGDALEAGGTVTGIERAGGIVRVACDFGLRAAERDLVLTGWARVAMPAAVFDALAGGRTGG